MKGESELTKLTNASDLAKFTKTKAAEFEMNVMNSHEFKNLVSAIETAAERGEYHINIDTNGFGGAHKATIFVKYLKEAGYKVSLFGPTLTISWSEVN